MNLDTQRHQHVGAVKKHFLLIASLRSRAVRKLCEVHRGPCLRGRPGSQGAGRAPRGDLSGSCPTHSASTTAAASWQSLRHLTHPCTDDGSGQTGSRVLLLRKKLQAHTHACSHMCTHAGTWAHRHVHTCTHGRMHTHILMHAIIHGHTHRHTCTRSACLPSPAGMEATPWGPGAGRCPGEPQSWGPGTGAGTFCSSQAFGTRPGSGPGPL